MKTTHTSKQPCPRRKVKEPPKTKAPSLKLNTKENNAENFIPSLIVRTGPRRQADPKFIRAVADDLLRWARTPGALSLEEYYDRADIAPMVINNWASKHDYFKVAKEKAKMAIGVRRENGWTKQEYTPKLHVSFHQYLERWKKSDEYHADLKKKAEGSETTGIVFVRGDKFPSSDIVPELKDKKDE